VTAFTRDRRVELLALMAAGEPLGRACALVGVSRWTVRRWAARGRLPTAPAEAREFALRLDRIRAGASNGDDPLSDGEPELLLARAARRGSVSALTELRRREHRPEQEPEPELPDDHPWTAVRAGDPFVALEPDQFARLSAEQQVAAIAVTERALDDLGGDAA
jgi:hypothetical protein